MQTQPLHRLHGPRRSPLAVLLSLCVFALAFAAAPADADAAADDPGEDTATPPKPVVTKPVFDVSAFKIYFAPDASAIDLTDQKLLSQPISLALVDGVYTRPQPGALTVEPTLEALSGDKAKRFDVTALRAIVDDLLDYIGTQANLVGVVVAPSPNDIGIDLSDKREGRTDLTILVRLATVGEVRTLASGDRIHLLDRENHPLHASIRQRSPLKAGDRPRTGSLLQRDVLDDFLYRLNRHPGRRVDAAVSPGLVSGDVTLDYLVAENKPWYVYFQLANTGTDSTGEWRERFGFVHNQLTAADDILAIDYITADFDQSHVVTLNYTRPIGERFEIRLHGLHSQFTADQVGSALNFIGEDTAVGATIAHNIYQNGPTFVDLVGGLEYYYTTAENQLAGTDGAQGLLMGTTGLELERSTDLSQTRGHLKLRGNLTQADRGEFAALGRTAPDTQFLLLQYGLSTSFYLEPILNQAAWEDISDPSTSTLAHELALGVRGQWAISQDRLVPTFQAVAGGLNTVRGYDQAEIAGDSSIIMTAEYRFHVPRIFDIQAPRRTALFDRPFRVAPESVYGRPDWDLVLKAFVDYAHLNVTDELAFESDDKLLSTGVGFEVSLKNNLNFRTDWGIALEDGGNAEAGDNAFHFVLTLLY